MRVFTKQLGRMGWDEMSYVLLLGEHLFLNSWCSRLNILMQKWSENLLSYKIFYGSLWEETIFARRRPIYFSSMSYKAQSSNLSWLLYIILRETKKQRGFTQQKYTYI